MGEKKERESERKRRKGGIQGLQPAKLGCQGRQKLGPVPKREEKLRISQAHEEREMGISDENSQGNSQGEKGFSSLWCPM